MRILVVATIYRCGEKIYPVIPHLTQRYSVDVLMFNEMSSETPWPGTIDPRQKFYDQCKKWGANVIQGKGHGFIQKHPSSKALLSGLKISDYGLVLLDDNILKSKRGTLYIANLAKKNKVIVCGCPHGNYEFVKYGVAQHINNGTLDFSFVFGTKEKRALGRRCNPKLLLPGGIPSNDALSSYKRTNEYILVITGYLVITSRKSDYLPFTEKTFHKSGILDLQQKCQCPVVIKEKSRLKFGPNLLLDSLSKHQGVSVIMDVDDDNDLVSRAKIVVGGASTLCFKSVQMGIPTILLKDFAMTGNFYDFPGLIECNKKSVLKSACHPPEYSDFVRRTLSGGDSFTSTQCYLDAIERIIKK